MFTQLTIKSVTIELTLSCMPMNQPRKAISDKLAGAAQIRMKKYCSARARTCGEQSTKRKTALTKGHCNRSMKNAIRKESPTPRQSSEAISCRSPRPQAWAVMPPVPTRRKPKFQYSRSKSMEPMDTPPISVAASPPVRCPAIARSTMPTSGTVMLARMLGRASRRISLLRAFIGGIWYPPPACRGRNCSALD